MSVALKKAVPQGTINIYIQMARRKTGQNTNKVSQKVNKPISKKFKLQKNSNENAQVCQIQIEIQELDQNQQNMSQQNSDQIYDLDKGLILEAKALRKYFKFNSRSDQNIPLMISVKALSSSEIVVSHQRQSLDLACVIDVSSSISGEKIKMQKKHYYFLLICLKIFIEFH
ncbi:hypothetical protein ABPG72_015633 [Tetrahymena utriculariae]